MFNCCCDGDDSHAANFFTSRSNFYAGWNRTQIFHQGPLFVCLIPGQAPSGFSGSGNRKKLYFSKHTHTYPGRDGCLTEPHPTASYPSISPSYLHVIRREGDPRREQNMADCFLRHDDGVLSCAQKSTLNSLVCRSFHHMNAICRCLL